MLRIMKMKEQMMAVLNFIADLLPMAFDGGSDTARHHLTFSASATPAILKTFFTGGVTWAIEKQA